MASSSTLAEASVSTRDDGALVPGEMIRAVRRHDAHAIHLIDDASPGAVNEIVEGESPMVVAARLGQCDTLDLLYSLGADPGLVVDEDGTTPLFALVAECPPRLRQPCLALLLGWGGVVIDGMCDLQTPLEYIGQLGGAQTRIDPGDMATIKTLIKYGAHVGQGTVMNRDTRDRIVTWAEGEIDSGLHPVEVATRLKRCHRVLETEREWDRRCCYAESDVCLLA